MAWIAILLIGLAVAVLAYRAYRARRIEKAAAAAFAEAVPELTTYSCESGAEWFRTNYRDMAKGEAHARALAADPAHADALERFYDNLIFQAFGGIVDQLVAADGSAEATGRRIMAAYARARAGA